MMSLYRTRAFVLTEEGQRQRDILKQRVDEFARMLKLQIAETDRDIARADSYARTIGIPIREDSDNRRWKAIHAITLAFAAVGLLLLGLALLEKAG